VVIPVVAADSHVSPGDMCPGHRHVATYGCRTRFCDLSDRGSSSRLGLLDQLGEQRPERGVIVDQLGDNILHRSLPTLVHRLLLKALKSTLGEAVHSDPALDRGVDALDHTHDRLIEVLSDLSYDSTGHPFKVGHKQSDCAACQRHWIHVSPST
jgi:hypothetical protein